MPNPCDDKRKARNAANEKLTDAAKSYKDAVEDYEARMGPSETIIGGVGAALVGLSTLSGPPGLAAALIITSAVGGTGAAVKQNIDSEKKDDRAVADAYEKYILAQHEASNAQKELDHCEKLNTGKSYEDDEQIAEEETSYEDEDEEDFSEEEDEPEDEEDSEEEDEPEDEEDSEEEDLSKTIYCPECGEEVMIGDFARPNAAGDGLDIECPYCETEFELDD